jgi:hypothetical protein
MSPIKTLTQENSMQLKNLDKKMIKKNARKETQERFTGSATQEQMQQMQLLMDELRWSRSKIIRLAIELMLETHRKNPKRYGV